MSQYKTIILALACSLFGAVLGVWTYDQFYNKAYMENTLDNYVKKASEREYLLGESLSKSFRSASPTTFIDAANNSIDAVVAIRGYNSKSFGSSRNISTTSGSGVVISNDGYIVTNYHVVEAAKDLIISFNDKREFEATLEGYDESTDLALLKIEADQLEYLLIGNSDSLQIGEWVLAIGNPFRLTSSVTAGIVSAKARSINILENRGIESFIQTDAAVNPGNSGGALINTGGKLVGINTAIMTYSGKYEGFSFAIPSNLMRKVVNDLRTYGAVQRGWMGISILEVSESTAKALDLDFIGGVLIDIADKKGAATAAGLQNNDVITSIDGMPTKNIPSFLEKLASYRPGDKLVVEYFRNGKAQKVDVILRNQRNTTELIAVRKDKVLKDLGFELRDLEPLEKTRLNSNGIIVVSVYKDSKIYNTNMDPGYIITKLNEKPIVSADDFIEQLKTIEGAVYLEGFYENYPGKYPYTFIK